MRFTARKWRARSPRPRPILQDIRDKSDKAGDDKYAEVIYVNRFEDDCHLCYAVEGRTDNFVWKLDIREDAEHQDAEREQKHFEANVEYLVHSCYLRVSV